MTPKQLAKEFRKSLSKYVQNHKEHDELKVILKPLDGEYLNKKNLKAILPEGWSFDNGSVMNAVISPTNTEHSLCYKDKAFDLNRLDEINGPNCSHAINSANEIYLILADENKLKELAQHFTKYEKIAKLYGELLKERSTKQIPTYYTLKKLSVNNGLTDVHAFDADRFKQLF